ncbi:hypothetical protein BH24ACT26_BH24ACT26_15710 [soil metagenome]
MWHEEVSGALGAELGRVGRKLELGDSVAGALAAARGALGEDASTLSSLLSMQERLGGDVAGMVVALASSLDRRADLLRAGRAAAAGAKLSGRMVAALPLLLLATLPLSRAPLFDGVGRMLFGAGLALAIAGIVAIERLVPGAPSRDDGAAVVADVTAGVLRGGVALDTALATIAEHPPDDVGAALARAGRLARLGVPWGDALARADDERLRSLARVVRHAEAMGLPIADALEEYARRTRDERLRALEATLRRAPVLMVVPLTLFVLPAFVLLGLAPFLRGLSVNW